MINEAQPNDTKIGLVITAVLISAGVIAGLLAWLLFKTVSSGYEYSAHQTAGNRDYDQDNYPAAIGEANAMIRLKPKGVEGYWLRGNSYLMSKRYAEAEQDYTKAIALETQRSDLANLYYCRANCYYWSNDSARAIADYSQAIVLNPRLTDAYEYRAWMYLREKKYIFVLGDCNAAIRQDPTRASMFGLRGWIYDTTGHEAAAIADYKKTIMLDPKDDDAYGELSSIYEHDKEYGKALALFKSGLLADPSNAKWWSAAGWFEYMTGDTDGGIRDSKKAVALDPKISVAWYNLGLYYAVKSDWPSAQAAYQHALSFHDAEDTNSGIDDIDNALKKHPGSSTLKQAKELLLTGAG